MKFSAQNTPSLSFHVFEKPRTSSLRGAGFFGKIRTEKSRHVRDIATHACRTTSHDVASHAKSYGLKFST